MGKKCSNPLFVFVTLVILFFGSFVFAKTDLSISETDITFSKEEILDGDLVKIYARVFNTGDTDISGNVVFLDDNKEMADPQPISVRANTYDDVFIDWRAKQGNHDIKVNIIRLNSSDDNTENNSTVKKGVFVDLDTDSDGIGNEKDADDDNDGLSDEEETKIGTDTKKSDTDGDGVSDQVDAFSKDKTESRDTDQDGLGDNKDLDDDGDGVFDQDELFKYGTNPLNTDTDADNLPDKQEVETGTNPNKTDTDSDGRNDSEDKYPLDPTKWQAGLLGSIAGFLGGNKNYAYLAIGIPALLVIFFLFFRKKRRRR